MARDATRDELAAMVLKLYSELLNIKYVLLNLIGDECAENMRKYAKENNATRQPRGVKNK